MKNSIITNAGLARLVEASIDGETLDIDKMVFANIANLNVDVTPDANTTIASSDIVYQATISNPAKIDDNTVVYSHVLAPSVGDFFINCIGLVESSSGTLIAVCYMPTHKKIATDGFVVGNTLYKNFAIQFQNIATISNITIDAQTWQFNFDDKYALKVHEHPYTPIAHATDAVLHITSTERTTWNNKSDQHTHPYTPIAHATDAVLHITSTERTTWNNKSDQHTHPYVPEAHGSNTDIHITSTERTTWNNKANASLDNIDENIDYIIERSTSHIKFHSGKIIQWGKVEYDEEDLTNLESNITTVTLPKPLADSQYIILFGSHLPPSPFYACGTVCNIKEKNATNFIIEQAIVGNGSTSYLPVTFEWMAISY